MKTITTNQLETAMEKRLVLAMAGNAGVAIEPKAALEWVLSCRMLGIAPIVSIWRRHDEPIWIGTRFGLEVIP